jgi:hypothetical protein
MIDHKAKVRMLGLLAPILALSDGFPAIFDPTLPLPPRIRGRMDSDKQRPQGHKAKKKRKKALRKKAQRRNRQVA